MYPVPSDPKIYHITPLQNLRGIIEQGVLWSDAKRIEIGLNPTIAGIADIKQQRLKDRPVTCHSGSKVGEYVPFYLCPRSIMLYILHMANHPQLSFRGGQAPMVHLVADLRAAVAWADQSQCRWALSDRNAAIRYAEFFASLDDLDKINWTAVQAQWWEDPPVKEGKQAESLLYESFPWHLIEKIGVINGQMKASVDAIVRGASHQPRYRSSEHGITERRAHDDDRANARQHRGGERRSPRQYRELRWSNGARDRPAIP